MAYVCAGKSFKSLSEAKVYAELVFKSKGVFAGIEAKPKQQKAAKKLAEARINRAMIGFRIPMMPIPKLYKSLEQAVEADWADAELQKIVGRIPGVEIA